MNIATLASAIVPVLFILVLGFVAGKRHKFDSDQASGISTLALNYALPAILFVAMAKLRRADLAADVPVLLVVLIVYVAIFVATYILAKRKFGPIGAAILALVASFPAAPVFGLAVLTPIFGGISGSIVGFTALACNIALVPATLVLISQHAKTQSGGSSGIASALQHAVASPLFWAPMAAVVLVLAGISVPALVDQSLVLLGTAASGVAIFSGGLVLASHRVSLSRTVIIATAVKMLIEPAALLVMLLLIGASTTLVNPLLVATALPAAVVGVLFASRYRVVEAESASILLVTTIAMIVVLPLSVVLTSHT